MDRIVSGNREDAPSVSHDDVSALAGDVETCPLQGLHGAKMRDARDSRHGSGRYIHFPHICPGREFLSHLDVFAYRIPDIRQSLFFRRTL
jgi:hypothetical protein